MDWQLDRVILVIFPNLYDSMILKLYSYKRHILSNTSDVYCTFPTVRWVSLILLRSASFPSSAGSFISARNSCRSELSSILNSGKVNLIFLKKKKKKKKKDGSWNLVWLHTETAPNHPSPKQTPQLLKHHFQGIGNDSSATRRRCSSAPFSGGKLLYFSGSEALSYPYRSVSTCLFLARITARRETAAPLQPWHPVL